MPSVLVTGCSSGFGLETARLVLDRGWEVVATLRRPRADLLPTGGRMRVLPLDVTRAESIAAVLAEAGPIDVLVIAPSQRLDDIAARHVGALPQVAAALAEPVVALQHVLLVLDATLAHPAPLPVGWRARSLGLPTILDAPRAACA